ncbi:MAG: alpha-mannosidase [Gemmatimonadota bacterium]|nr:MAG: alpha-mannosidase [Gemmatimonadota bacterium]
MRSSSVLLGLLLTLVSPLRSQDLVIKKWLVSGPIPSGRGEERVLADQLGGDASSMPTLGDEGWVEAETDPFGRLNLNEVFAGQATEWSAAYGHVYVFAPEDRTLLLVADSDDDLVIHVNGQRVWVNEVARGLGTGSDSVTVRLAEGWNSLLLKPLNRGGGFGLLARLSPGAGIELSTVKPPGLVAHNHPKATVTVGPIFLREGLSWRGGELAAGVRLPIAAWGSEPFADVSLELEQGGRTLERGGFAEIAPGKPAEIELTLGFDALQQAAIGEAPFVAATRWSGGSDRADVFVNADQLLRLVGGRIAIDGLVVDSTGGAPVRISAELAIPDAFDGLSVDLATRGLGPNAAYRVNERDAEWRTGDVELCAPCSAGEQVRIEIALESGRPLWMMPVLRVREIGYAEYADGYEYAKTLAGRAPEIERPDPAEWLRARGSPSAAAYQDLLRRYREAYAPLAAEIRRDTLHLIGNSHIDAAWLAPWSETRDVIRETWRTSLKLAEIFPGYIFSGSHAAFYDMLDRLEPGLSDSLSAAVESGRWVPVGGWWVESDLNVPSGESLVRQGLYGQRYFERRFGSRSKVAWTPDCFGYPWTIPQILQGAGLEYFVTQKIRWNDSTEFAYNAFHWEGLDGTRVLTYNPYGYTHNLNAGQLVAQRIEDRERTGINHQLVLYGVGDHGGGPTIAMLERAGDLRRVPTFPAMVYDRPLEALETVREAETGEGFPVWDDELYLEYHRGTYTTQGLAKQRNRRSEVMLQTAEALATVATTPYPRERLEEAWRLVLFNQFHDILPGSSIREVYEDAEIFYDSAWAILKPLTLAAFDDLRARMNTRGRGRAVVVFNPLGWERSGSAAVLDESGDIRVVTLNGVPAFGARVVHLPRDAMSREDRRLAEPRAGANWIENAYLRVEIDTLTGEIVRVYDRENEREALAPGGRASVLQIFDDRPGQWDAWNIVIWGDRWDVQDVRRVEVAADEREARINIERRWGESVFRQTLMLARGSRILDVYNEVDWHEHRKLLKVGFELGVDADSATYEIPYGTIGRSGNPRTKAERAKFEVPGHRWADVSAAGYGVSILNDSKYGWDYKGNVLRLSLLRSPVWPDSLADRGTHQFRFAIYPHAGDWRAAGTVRRAAEYNVPLVAGLEPQHPGALGTEVSFAVAEPGSVELAWLKRAEDSEAWVLRLVEWHGQPAEARVRLACEVSGAWRANLLEDRGEAVAVDGRSVRVSIRPYEIATVIVGCER